MTAPQRRRRRLAKIKKLKAQIKNGTSFNNKVITENPNKMDSNGVIMKTYGICEYSYKASILNQPTKKRNKKSKTSLVYFIELWNDKERFLKVGLTTQSIKNRFAKLPYRYKILATIDVSKIALFEYEQAIHEIFKTNRYYPKIKFSGYTECYVFSSKKAIMKLF